MKLTFYKNKTVVVMIPNFKFGIFTKHVFLNHRKVSATSYPKNEWGENIKRLIKNDFELKPFDYEYTNFS